LTLDIDKIEKTQQLDDDVDYDEFDAVGIGRGIDDCKYMDDKYFDT